MKQQFIVDTPDTFQSYIYEYNRAIVPSSASLTVYRPASDAKLIDAEPMTIGSDGLLTYSLNSAHNDIAGENYKAIISYAYNAKSCYLTLFYDVVNARLAKVITDADIVAELPQLKDNGWKVRGTADSGSTTTIVDAGLKRYEDDYFTGGLAYSVAKDEVREITDFVSSTGVVTAEAFSAAIAAEEQYILTRPYTREINRAFEKIEEKLKQRGRRAHLILDAYDLREVHIYYATAEVCKGLATENNSLWWHLWKEYEKTGDDAFLALDFKYDSSVDGYIANGEKDLAFNTTRVARR